MPYKDREKQLQYNKEYKQKIREGHKAQKINITPEEREQRRKEKQKQYTETHKEWFAERRQIYIQKCPQKRLLWSARKRAKEQNLPFNLTEEDIILPTNCPYLGIKLITNAKQGESRANVYSLDKIKPELGYIQGNVEVISHLANTMKSNATEEQLIAFAETILNRYKKGSI